LFAEALVRAERPPGRVDVVLRERLRRQRVGAIAVVRELRARNERDRGVADGAQVLVRYFVFLTAVVGPVDDLRSSCRLAVRRLRPVPGNASPGTSGAGHTHATTSSS
jgi:hypothetical protein